jgi:trans-aconitate methyltransferase
MVRFTFFHLKQLLAMKVILKRMVMLVFGPPVKYIISQMGLHNETNQKLHSLEQRIHDIYPDQWRLNESTLLEIDRIKKVLGLPAGLNMEISKNDMMLLHFINNGFSVDAAVRAYLVRGVSLLDMVSKVAEKRWGSDWARQVGPFLDFASGYGTLERHLISMMPAERIYTADVKTHGVDFQIDKFGVNGVYSSFIPEEFKPAIRFQFIFVASLFSHLPEDLFRRWLTQLWNCLAPGGVLAFTVHDTSLRRSEEDFIYSARSEDSDSVIEDSIKNANVYGTTFVSERYLERCFGDLDLSKDHYTRYKLVSSGLQDIYIVSKAPVTFDNIRFNVYDSEAI